MNTPLFDSLEIRQFRAFDFLKIDQLGNVNLFLGKNNIGKSSLLEALYLYANAGSPFHIQGILSTREESRSAQYTKEDEPAPWNLFYGRPSLEQVRETIQIGRIGAPDSALMLAIVWMEKDALYTDKFVTKNIPILYKEKIPSLWIKYGTEHRILHLNESFDSLCRNWVIREIDLQSMSVPCVFIGPDGIHTSALQAYWKDIALTDAKLDVLEALRIISPDVDDFALLPQPRVHTFYVRLKGQETPIPIKSMGDGMNRVAGLSIGLTRAKGGILLVDEIENGIHWSVLPKVWKFIVKVAKRLNVQVFATTHSNDCLRAFHSGAKGEVDAQGIAVRLEKRDGEFHAEIFDERRLALIVKERIEIR